MSPDLTIESALSDPMIRAVMRADGIEPQVFERLLRSTARSLEAAPRRAPSPPAAFVPKAPGIFTRGFCCA